MGLDSFTLKVMTVFVPGYITYFTMKKFAVQPEHSLVEKILYSFISGFPTYGLYFLILYNLEFFFDTEIGFYFAKILSGEIVTFSFTEILLASLVGVYLGTVFSIVTNNLLINRLAQKLGLTNKFGELDVWDHVLNSEDIEWVVVRDFDKDIVYYGLVEAYSDAPDEYDELFLRNVKIYNNKTGEFIENSPGVYLAKNREQLHIEFPGLAEL